MLSQLYNLWFNEKTTRTHWFNQSDDFDDMIFQKYRHFIHKQELINNPTKNEFVSLIILYDQIVRHMYRNNKILINKYHQLILPYVNEHYHKYYNELNADEFSFVLMPLRHTNNFSYISFVMRETWNKILKYPDEPQYKRFLEATYKRYIKLNSDEDNLIFFKESNLENYNIYNFIDYKYLDNKCYTNSLLNDNYKVKSFHEIEDNEIIKQFVNKYKIKDCIISLSGGVDSMVLSYYLKKLGVNIYAVHINYLNRTECENEEDIIINWCKNINIPLYIRQIDEIKRKMCMDNNLRELYEDYTRDIRYQAYRNTIKQIKKDNIYICLGHNKDDCFENIITNIASKSHYENLWGMDELVKQSDIIFARPMLPIDKKSIYKMAHDANIPYFVDSTPKWSQRGKIRDIVRPTLEEYNSQMIESLFYLSETIKTMKQFISIRCDTVIEQIKKDNKLNININELETNSLYWNEILNKMNINISKKSLIDFIKRIENMKLNYNQLKNNDKHKHMLNKNTYIIYWKTIDEKIMIEFIGTIKFIVK